MTAKSSRRMVIDASVARASGGRGAVSPTSNNCSDFLQTVLVVCHQIVLTTEILEEWQKHKSRFASRWLASMLARKKSEKDRLSRGSGATQQNRSSIA